jgi:hypothetical protein
LTTIAVGINKGFLDGVFGNRPNIFTAAEVTFGHFHNALPAGAGSYVIYTSRHFYSLFWQRGSPGTLG